MPRGKSNNPTGKNQYSMAGRGVRVGNLRASITPKGAKAISNLQAKGNSAINSVRNVGRNIAGLRVSKGPSAIAAGKRIDAAKKKRVRIKVSVE